MAYLAEALNDAFGSNLTPQEKGRKFEPILARALIEHPGEWGNSRFVQIWTWMDWPQRKEFGYSIDTGIDLVAKDTPEWGGKFTAIQSKFGYSGIATSEINSFLADSSNVKVFGNRLLVADRKISALGELKIEHSDPRCQILRISEIDDWIPDWRQIIPDRASNFQIELPKHDLRPYQIEALEAIKANFDTNNRGKLILPCGTGKSFVALRAAEENAGGGKTVLYLVPSISLMGQTMREWSRNRTIAHQYIGICSDSTAGKKDLEAESYAVGQFSELTMPVTTEQEKITEALLNAVPTNTMRVVFSTYQSSIKIMNALKSEALSDFSFDVAICDEAHRTTGIENQSSADANDGRKPFQLVHSDERIRIKKRLYMTATPRVFAENVRKRMEEHSFDGQSYSMDDFDTYGEVAYRMSFADAISGGWLSDYRVIVIGVSEQEYLQRAKSNPITVDDAGTLADPATVVRLAGCWDALATPKSQSLQPDRNLGQLESDEYINAGSAIAFTSRIKESKTAEKLWSKVATWYQEDGQDLDDREYLALNIKHLDAQTPASERARLIEELRQNPPQGTCRVLTNVGVLSEGVDVPALDAVVFLQSRSSPVDVTQAVGRVMRKAPGKEVGFVVIPIVVPAFNVQDTSSSVEELLSASDFKPVWDVIRALRSHDERIDHMLEARTMPVELRIPTGRRTTPGKEHEEVERESHLIFGVLEELNEHFGSIMLDTCGDRHMYPNWGNQAGRVCEQIEIRIQEMAKNYKSIKSNLEAFTKSLQSSVSPNITFDQTLRMVAHHLVTVPVFEELFGDSMFADRNPITQSMNEVVAALLEIGATFESERAPLKRAYSIMNTAFKSASDSAKRLDVLRAIFDGFFRKAMPDEVKTMGIAYTPIELVDFIIRFTNQLCKREFGVGLTGRDVHILDPFAGTGTFLAHLMECKDDEGNFVITDEDLNRKYEKELHANELVLLAYYITALKIEETKHRRSMMSTGATNSKLFPYQSFDHIVLADTFHLSDTKRGIGTLFGDLDHNTLRANDQLDAPVRVIFGNPPWSTGKDDASETASKIEYKEISERVNQTYVAASALLRGGTVGGNAAGNLFVKAFRWASDRVMGTSNLPSIVAFVSPNSLSDGTSLVGMRKVLRDEFSDIYVINLRGNAYKAGEEFKKEGDKIFGGASRNGVQITFLVRNPQKDLSKPANLHYAMVPERMNILEKFDWLKNIQDEKSDKFQLIPITPKHDWISPEDPNFANLLTVCKENDSSTEHLVEYHCRGIATSLDAYVYAFSLDELKVKVSKLIDEFNQCLQKYIESDSSSTVFDEITNNSAIDRIKWTSTLKAALRRKQQLQFDESRIREVLYRPFTKVFLYEDWQVLSAGRSAAQLFPRDSYTEQKLVKGGGGVFVSTTQQLPYGLCAGTSLFDLGFTGRRGRILKQNGSS